MKINSTMNMSFEKSFSKNNVDTSDTDDNNNGLSKDEITCKFCGAPVRTEICPYCGKPTGLDTASAPMEYPELSCKETNLDFWGIVFPLIFAAAFGFFGFLFPIAFSSLTGEGLFVNIVCIPFALISIVSLAIVVKNLYMYLIVIIDGKEIEGRVYGYMDDTVLYNDIPGQVCKLLVTTSQGKRFIMYQLKNTTKPYPINKIIPIKVYKDRFLLIDKNKYASWD